MTDPTPAEALKVCPNPECQSDKIDVLIRDIGSARGISPQGQVECFDCGVRGPMTCGYSGGAYDRCAEKAKSEAARLWNAFAALPSPATDAGEVRKAPQWADDRDPMGDLAIKLAARASAIEEEEGRGEWTWREIAECAAEALGAGEVRTWREGVEAACVAFEEAISKGYPTPANKRDQCAHATFGWQDCIACYDEALTAAIAAIRGLAR